MERQAQISSHITTNSRNVKPQIELSKLDDKSSGIFLEMRHHIPPNLHVKNLGKRISAYRPSRTGALKLDIQNINGKWLINNYGHGSNGWTLSPACASYVVSLLQEKIPSKNEPISIIGSGCVGLFTALELIDKGYTNLTIIAKEFDDTTSHRAGAIFTPMSLEKNNEFLHGLIVKSHSYWIDTYNGLNKHLTKDCVKLLPLYTTVKIPMFEYQANVVYKPAKNVVVNFGNGVLKKLFAYDDFVFFQPLVIMESLSKILEDKGVKFVKREVKKFEEISDDFIVNCSAIGSKELQNDDEMINEQGHLIMLKDAGLKEDYMLIAPFEDGKTPDGIIVTRTFYMLPKEDAGEFGVIGGTFIKGVKLTDVNAQEFDVIVKNARSFFGIN